MGGCAAPSRLASPRQDKVPDLEAATLRIVGKNGDERLLPVSPHLAQCAQDYLFQSRPRLCRDPREQALFLGQRGRRLSDQSFRCIVRRYGLKLGLELTAHQIRHTCATHLVEAVLPLAFLGSALPALAGSKGAWACEAAIGLYLRHGFVHDAQILEFYGPKYAGAEVGMSYPV